MIREMAGINGLEWLVVALVAFLVGMAKSGFGGLGIVGMVLMAMVMPARQSTGALLTLLIVADVFAVIAFRRHADWRQVLRLLPPAVVGIVCGFLLMPHIPDRIFRPVLGWIAMGLVALLIWQRKASIGPRFAEHPFVGTLTGWVSGVTTMLANAAGPVMTIYLLARRMPKMEFVGTAAWFFFVVNVLKVPFSWGLGLITAESLMLTIVLIPAVGLGGFCGRALVRRMNQRIFENLMVVFTLLGALRLIAG